MKAVVYDVNGGPEVMRYEEVPDPAVRDGGLLLEVRAIGIQGGDVINRREGPLSSTPHIVGYQASGVVREIGPGVDGFACGDRVVAMMMRGSHAELASVPARKTWRIPEGLSFEDAAAVPVEFGTADDCLFEFGRLQAGETVLVQAGSGGVGLAATQLAKAAGATVLSTSVADGRLQRLSEFGADHGIDYRTQKVAEVVMQLTDGRGVDLVVDPVGGLALEGSVASLAYRGRISWMGNAGAGGHRPDLWPLMEKNASVTAVFFAMEQSKAPERTYQVIERCLQRIGTGELKAVVDRTYALADAAEAHRYVEAGVAFGRVVLVP